MFRKRHCSLLPALAVILMLVFTSGCASSGAEPQNSSTDAAQAEEPATTGQNNDNSTAEESDEVEDPAAAEDPVEFEDPVFFELIKKELGKEEIHPEDLAGYTSIKIAADEFVFLAAGGEDEKSIIHFNENAFEYDGVRYEGFGTMKSLADLKYFTSLDKIYITLQPEIDYSTIPEEISKKVRIVLIYQSRVEDIGFLEKFENLISLTLNTNNIKDLSPLEGKDKILWLNFDWNGVQDLTPVASLTALKAISAYSNQISDLTALSGLPNLEDIELYNNLIKDISPLKEIKTLKVLELINNQIEDVSPLSEFEAFEELRLTGNPITNIEVLSHITNLEF